MVLPFYDTLHGAILCYPILQKNPAAVKRELSAAGNFSANQKKQDQEYQGKGHIHGAGL